MAQEYGWTRDTIEHLSLKTFQRHWGIIVGYETGWKMRRGET
jgi:hypothetical protein